jgi:hypothetical protein
LFLNNTPENQHLKSLSDSSSKTSNFQLISSTLFWS